MNKTFVILISTTTVLLLILLIVLALLRQDQNSSNTINNQVFAPTSIPLQRFSTSSSNGNNPATNLNTEELPTDELNTLSTIVAQLPHNSDGVSLDYSPLLDTFYIQRNNANDEQISTFLKKNNLLELFQKQQNRFKFVSVTPSDAILEDEKNATTVQDELFLGSFKPSGVNDQLLPLKNLLKSLTEYEFPTPSTITEESQNPIPNKTDQPIGSFQSGTKVPNVDTSALSCPSSPTVSTIGIRKVYANGVGFYNIKLCKVHGYSINASKAKDFDNLYNAMKAAGYKPVSTNNKGLYVRDGGGPGNFRSYETQLLMHQRSPNSSATAGGSNHERGLAVDTSCANNDTTRLYKPWMSGKARGLDQFAKAIADHPCLRWLHNNASQYGLLLQCDGIGSRGEIAKNTGGCETWHLSPNGH